MTNMTKKGKQMKISIISDLHIDFWVNPNKNKISGGLERELNRYLDKSEDVEVLIIAGDISHYNHQIELIEQIAEDWNYKKVFCVLGNHDLYLISQSQIKKYKDSKGRQDAWYKYKDPKGIVEILNGDVVEYKGVKFGGAASWYDGSMIGAPSVYSYISPVKEWNQVMNDSRLIKGYNDFYDIWEQEKPKVEAILDADVIITHVNPLAENFAFQEQYRFQSSNKFYAFDGEDYLDKTKAKYWVFGHSHGFYEYEIYGTKCIMNALGYPNEKTNCKKTIIEVFPSE